MIHHDLKIYKHKRIHQTTSFFNNRASERLMVPSPVESKPKKTSFTSRSFPTEESNGLGRWWNSGMMTQMIWPWYNQCLKITGHPNGLAFVVPLFGFETKTCSMKEQTLVLKGVKIMMKKRVSWLWLNWLWLPGRLFWHFLTSLLVASVTYILLDKQMY